MLKKLSTILCLCLLSSCSAVEEKVGLKQDNVFEEVIEKLIKDKTSFDIDLTPESKE